MRSRDFFNPTSVSVIILITFTILISQIPGLGLIDAFSAIIVFITSALLFFMLNALRYFLNPPSDSEERKIIDDSRKLSNSSVEMNPVTNKKKVQKKAISKPKVHVNPIGAVVVSPGKVTYQHLFPSGSKPQKVVPLKVKGRRLKMRVLRHFRMLSERERIISNI